MTSVSINQPIRLVFSLLISIIIFFITFSVPTGIMQPGLDTSWIYSINYFFATDILIGKTAVFTYGPLGFLLFPEFIGNNALLAIVFWSALSFFTIFSIVNLTLIVHRQSNLFFLVPLLIVLTVFFSILEKQYYLFFLSLSLLIYHHLNQKKLFYLIAAVLLSTLALFMKSGLAVISILALGSYLITLCIQDIKHYKLTILALAVLLFSPPLAWVSLYHTLNGFIPFMHATLEFISGNSSAMVISPRNSLWLLLGVACFFSIYFAYAKNFRIQTFRALLNNSSFVAFAVCVLPYLAWFKYSIGREDGHFFELIYLNFAIGLFILLLVNHAKRFVIILCLTLLSTFFLYKNALYIGQDFSFDFNVKGLEIFNKEIIHYKEYKTATLAAYKTNLAPLTLPSTMLKMIGQNTVDVYPWQSIIIPANNLKWQPRPVFQSYVAYTPYLDKLNESFFKDGNGADFIILDMNDLISIDGRYLLNDEPLTIYQIFNLYKPVAFTKTYTLFAKQSKPQLTLPVNFATTQASIRSWIPVPKSNFAVVRANITLHRSLVGMLARNLYKDGVLLINYQLEDNTITTKRLVIDNVKNGVWVSPLLSGINPKAHKSHLTFLNLYQGKRVKAIQLIINKHIFNKNIQIKWIGFNLEK